MLDKNDTKAIAARIDAVVDRAIAEERIVGTVLLVRRGGEPIYTRVAGFMDREAGVPMREDAIFRLASLTKPIVATTALAMVDAGLLGLDDEVSQHLPYFQPRWSGEPASMRIRHLLTHTSGLSYDPALLAAVEATGGMSGPIIPLDENVRRIGQIALKFEPGTGWEYGVSIDVLGCVLATINGSSLGEVVERYVTGPLGMADTRFGVSDVGRLAVPYANRALGAPVRMGDTTQGMNPDGTPGPVFSPSRIFNPLAPQSGGSGMASSGPDFMRLIETLRQGGGSILRKETTAAALSNQVGTIARPVPKDAGKRFGFLGGVLDEPAVARSPAPRGTVDWGGVYGHNWFIDPVNEISVVSMSNTALEGCNGPYREEIRDAVYGAGR